MSIQLHVAFGIVEGRVHPMEDKAMLRTVQLVRREQRRSLRAARRSAR
jgi:hypothetical protein